ncbi:MAG: gliding motility-associated C-terminal domain-containing protein [Chitinophagales bacterium]
MVIGNQILKETGNYTIHLKTSIGCDSLINITLRTIPIKEETLSRTICQGETIQIGNQTFSQAGSYEIKLTSAENCDSIVHLNLTVNPLPIIDATADKSQALPNEDIQLNVISNETLSYHWSPSDLLNNAHIQNPIAQIQATTLFTVVATNQRTNCSNSDSVLVNIQYLPCTNTYIYIPNAFTPNNDGNNDVLYVRSENLKEMHIEIFDRWGLKVFESNSINDGWDGTYKGSALPAEVYGYYFKGTCLEGKNIVLKGNITLLR